MALSCVVSEIFNVEKYWVSAHRVEKLEWWGYLAEKEI